jgi:hypothetical protein
MVTYIYFVKCPNCEDEHFDFFDEAKEFALGCLSQKPIITQTEVCRNDFGECTDSCDLGTVWSWEDMMSDDGYTEAEPTKSIFTKDDLKLMADGKDPEFDNLDNSVDFEPEILDRKPISENAIQDGGFRTDGYRTALACYDSDDFDINVEFGMQDEEEFPNILTGEGGLDYEKVGDEISAQCHKMIEQNPDIGAILLECTDMPPYAHRLQAEFNMPVYDAITLIRYAKTVVTQTPYYGFL